MSLFNIIRSLKNVPSSLGKLRHEVRTLKRMIEKLPRELSRAGGVLDAGVAPSANLVPTVPEVQWTAYIQFLTWVNGGMLTRGNVDCFAHAMEFMPEGLPVLEIGSFCGLSANLISLFKRKYGRNVPLFCCDPWISVWAKDSTIIEGSPGFELSEFRVFIKETCLRNVSFFSSDDRPHMFETDSDSFFRDWEARQTHSDLFGRDASFGGMFAFAYIDGDHEYDQAKKDFINVDRWLAPGGFVLFDDSSGGHDGSTAVAQEVKAHANYELVAANPNLFFRKRR